MILIHCHVTLHPVRKESLWAFWTLGAMQYERPESDHFRVDFSDWWWEERRKRLYQRHLVTLPPGKVEQ